MDKNELKLEFGVHDPTMIEVGGVYYLYSTDTDQPQTSGVPVRTSKNLIDWEFLTTALPEIPIDAQKWSSAKGLWAPEVVVYNKTYRMYYSASTFGSTTSCIGLATADTPAGPFVDRGCILKTSPELCNHNAIDANVVIDKDGEHWLVYGSFFGGIYILSLDKETGRPREDAYGKCIAKRSSSVDKAIEGCFVMYNPETDYYYLFCSYDSLNNTYNIRVARSRHIDGGYVDMLGHEMTNLTDDPSKIGVKLLGSYQFENEPPVYAPGHNSIFRGSDHQQFLVHHARLQPFSNRFFLNIRSLQWLTNGWPVVSPMLFESQSEQVKLSLAGSWDLIVFTSGNQLHESQEIRISAQDVVSVGMNEFQWKDYLVKAWNEVEHGRTVTCLSGLSSDGLALLGKKVVAKEEL